MTKLPRHVDDLVEHLRTNAPPAREPDGWYRVVEPLTPGKTWRSPEERLDILAASLGAGPEARVFWREVYEWDILKTLARQTGPEDTPSYSPERLRGAAEVLSDWLGHLDAGRRLIQYEVEWTPEWMREARGEFLPAPPLGWLPLDAVLRLKGLRMQRTVRSRCAQGLLTAERCKGGVWYVDPDERLDLWIARLPEPGAVWRRLRKMGEVLGRLGGARTFADNEALYGAVAEWEAETEVVTGYYEKYPLGRYLERCLEAVGEAVPATPAAWARALPALTEAWRERRALDLDRVRPSREMTLVAGGRPDRRDAA